jgi:Domain of unknown function (DUF4499)
MAPKVKLSIPSLAAAGVFMTILTLLAFKDDILPEVVRKIGFFVLQNPRVAKFFAIITWLAHVYEARVAYNLSQRKGLSPSAGRFYGGLAFIFGFPVINALKDVKRA